MKKQLIYLPIETKSREFDSRCLIALACINQGKAVVISPAGRFRPTHPGVVLLKSAAGFQIDKIRQLKEQGMLCAVIDEEGFVQTRNETQRALRYSQETLDAVDRVFYNGKAEYDLLNKFYKINPEKGIITGNPRFDFYKPGLREYYRQDAEKLRKQYGPYILITSRFGNVTPARDTNYLDFVRNTRRIQSEDQLDIFRAFYEHSKQIYSKLLDLVPKLAKAFSRYKIVIRPHPSETPDYWRKAGEGCSNVTVTSAGPIGPWVLGAEAVLHNGCTTGLEAFLMCRPVYAYTPVHSDEFDLKLPNKVSMAFEDDDSLIRSMNAQLLNPTISNDNEVEKNEYIRYFMNNSDGGDASREIADQLVLLANKLPMAGFDLLKQRPLLRRYRHRISKFITELLLVVDKLGVPLSSRMKERVYSRQKNPGYSRREIINKIQKIGELAGASTARLQVLKLDEDVFLVYQAE